MVGAAVRDHCVPGLHTRFKNTPQTILFLFLCQLAHSGLVQSSIASRTGHQARPLNLTNLNPPPVLLMAWWLLCMLCRATPHP